MSFNRPSFCAVPMDYVIQIRKVPGVDPDVIRAFTGEVKWESAKEQSESQKNDAEESQSPSKELPLQPLNRDEKKR